MDALGHHGDSKRWLDLQPCAAHKLPQQNDSTAHVHIGCLAALQHAALITTAMAMLHGCLAASCATTRSSLEHDTAGLFCILHNHATSCKDQAGMCIILITILVHHT